MAAGSMPAVCENIDAYTAEATMAENESLSGSHRLQTFSDAVFAFACTLLVVSLEVPKSFAELKVDLSGFVAFGLAFATLIHIWSAHHKLFRRFPLDDAWSVLLNSCLLFVVLFFVYPLKFLSVALVSSLFGIGEANVAGFTSNAEVAQLFMIYGAAFASVFGLLALLYRHAAKQCLKSQRAADSMGALAHGRHYWLIVGIALLSIVCAWFGWGITFGLPGWLYMLIGPTAWLNGVLGRRAKRRAGA
jgi:uncharacterized membrane protein